MLLRASTALLRRRLPGCADRRDLRSESGQMLPLIGALAVVFLICGMAIYWIGTDTVIATNAQTAADAAALAGESELIDELDTPQTDGAVVVSTGTFDLATVCAKAGAMAARNQATVTSCQSATGSGDSPYDLIVQVKSDRASPANAVAGAGRHALASARASNDSGAAASVSITQTQACVAGLLVGAPFTAHGGRTGFFPASHADFTPNCEARLAGELDRLGIADKLHLTGVTGTLSNPPTKPTDAQTLEACSAAATVTGLARLTSAQLAQFGIVRPIAGRMDLVSMEGSDACSTQSSDSSTTPDSDGTPNLNIHLVPLDGGPVASQGLTLAGGIPAAPTASQIQVACTIYAVWQSQHLSQKELQVALDVAQTESTMGQNLYGDGSYGVFQQEPAYWYESQIGGDPIQQELDPQIAAEMFFEGADDNKTAGLEKIFPAVSGAPIWEIAQDVQGSGAGKATGGAGNYGLTTNLEAEAQFYQSVTGGKCKSVASV